MLSHIKVGKEILTFGEIKTEKNKFYRHKTPVFLKDVDTEKVLVLSKKISSGEKNYKCFIGSLYNDDKIKPLNMMLPKTSAYVKNYGYIFLFKMMTY